jgi:hypothetical protein
VGRLLDLSLSFNIFSNPAIIIFLVGVTCYRNSTGWILSGYRFVALSIL